MKPPPDPHYDHRLSAKIIGHAVLLHHVFSFSLRDASKAMVVKVSAKGRTRSHQVRSGDASASEPLMTWRNASDDAEAGGTSMSTTAVLRVALSS
jgi:hypothetical protein